MIHKIFKMKAHDVIMICVVALSLLNHLPQNFSYHSQKIGYAVSEKKSIILNIVYVLYNVKLYMLCKNIM